MFFFQAEDGIRDLVRSRGLGDVYKRQLLDLHVDALVDVHLLDLDVEKIVQALQALVGVDPVSYTHLTLPTSDLV